jgi:RNAse (barnase) inhibitor barstar
MNIVTIDCSGIRSDEEFCDAYLMATLPEGRHLFGRNLDAFWDAVSAGGPGCPGGDCELRFINTKSIMSFREGKFYEALKEIATRSEWVRIYVE